LGSVLVMGTATIRMDTAITRTDTGTIDRIDTTAITTGAPITTGTVTTATIDTIITINATN